MRIDANRIFITNLPSKRISCEEGSQQLDGMLPDGAALVLQSAHHQLQEVSLSGQRDRLGGEGWGSVWVNKVLKGFSSTQCSMNTD